MLHASTLQPQAGDYVFERGEPITRISYALRGTVEVIAGGGGGDSSRLVGAFNPGSFGLVRSCTVCFALLGGSGSGLVAQSCLPMHSLASCVCFALACANSFATPRVV